MHSVALARSGNRVPAAAVQQTVHSAGRAVGQVALLDERDVDAPHREVPGDATPGRTAADDEDFGHFPPVGDGETYSYLRRRVNGNYSWNPFSPVSLAVARARYGACVRPCVNGMHKFYGLMWSYRFSTAYQ